MTDLADLIARLKASAAMMRSTPRHENSGAEAGWLDEAADTIAALSSEVLRGETARSVDRDAAWARFHFVLTLMLRIENQRTEIIRLYAHVASTAEAKTSLPGYCG